MELPFIHFEKPMVNLDQIAIRKTNKFITYSLLTRLTNRKKIRNHRDEGYTQTPPNSPETERRNRPGKGYARPGLNFDGNAKRLYRNEENEERNPKTQTEFKSYYKRRLDLNLKVETNKSFYKEMRKEMN